MPYRRRRRAPRKLAPRVPRATQRIRQLAGQAPVTRIERLAAAAGQVGQVARTVSMLSGLINSEKKYLETGTNLAINNASPYVASLTSVGQGDDENQRNGRKILYDSLDLHYMFKLTTPTVDNDGTFGLAIVLDKRPDIGTPTWTNIFAFNNAQSFLNKDNTERYIILKRWVLQPNANAANSRISIKKHFNLKGLHLKFDGTAATDFESNPIYIVATSNDTTSGTLFGYARLNYYDN